MSVSDDDVTFDPRVTGAVTGSPDRSRQGSGGQDAGHDDRTRPDARPADAQSAKAASFAPGTIIAGRYRVVALLGRGGMGEVYRADDLTLDQPVALKFLPPAPIDDARLVALHDELRVARQVSHPNVCRLYDIGEAGRPRFLTMEYVDGEDLARCCAASAGCRTTRRCEIARQLCAGVAAAHERGVLHRDLKPANVMIDGEGDVRITDFGLATRRRGDGASRRHAAYMAPEQLAGRPATVRSDIYALGLVLYEIFTGRRAHESQDARRAARFHQTGRTRRPRRSFATSIRRSSASSCAASSATRAAPGIGARRRGGACPAATRWRPRWRRARRRRPRCRWRRPPNRRRSASVRGLALSALPSPVLLVFRPPRAHARSSDVPLDEPPAVLDDRARSWSHRSATASRSATRHPASWRSTTTDWSRRQTAGADSLGRLHRRAARVLFWYRASPRRCPADGPRW